MPDLKGSPRDAKTAMRDDLGEDGQSDLLGSLGADVEPGRCVQGGEGRGEVGGFLEEPRPQRIELLSAAHHAGIAGARPERDAQGIAVALALRRDNHGIRQHRA